MAKKPTKDTATVLSALQLQEEYQTLRPSAERFRNGLAEQLQQIIARHSLALAIPIESRVKALESIAEKCERRALNLRSVVDLHDLVGLRLIFLFSRDLQTASAAINETFTVVTQEDAVERLGESQFGYQSLHLIIQIPKEWAGVPVFADCERFQAEVQLRTIAQHTWAAASHHLQYKQESGVPLQVRRSIHRVSALLETVDLEFERVLNEREAYLAGTATAAATKADEPLNVDVLTTILDAKLPSANRKGDEDYAGLLTDLRSADITNVTQLTNLIDAHLKAALTHDAMIVASKEPHRYISKIPERTKKGVYLTYVGLVRQMLIYT